MKELVDCVSLIVPNRCVLILSLPRINMRIDSYKCARDGTAFKGFTSLQVQECGPHRSSTDVTVSIRRTWCIPNNSTVFEDQQNIFISLKKRAISTGKYQAKSPMWSSWNVFF